MHRSEATVDSVVECLGRKGYALVEDMLSPAAVEAAAGEMRRILAETPTGRDEFEGYRTRRVYALFAKTRAFDDAAVDPLVLGVLDRVLGHYQLSAPTGIEIGPGEVAQVLHFDDGIYPLSRPHAELVCNTMWALDPFTAANGATRIVPASHNWIDEKAGPDTVTVPAEMPAGAALFYLGTLWHGGGANATDAPRLGVILEYVVSWLRAQENHILAVPADVVRTLTPRLQELLGYNIHPPFMGYVDGRHPRRILERGG
jgi:ectoine hydroxylase-related dioxygenase (phytanoyl-CoA dioxygenase family)